MKVVFCSNYMNHHQLYFSKAMLNLGVDYKFIACETISQERKDGGWEDMNDKYEWVIKFYDESQRKEAKKLIQDADLVIIGSFPIKYIRKSVLKNKPVFLYSERWYKSYDGDMQKFKTFPRYVSNLLRKKYFHYFNVYMLCASGYTAYDCSLYNNFKGKCYKWGYFPKVQENDVKELLKCKKDNNVIKILWVARFLDWKHPEDAVMLAKQLKEDGYNFELNMIGVGEKLEEIRGKIEELDLQNQVRLLGAMPNEKVREYMHKSNIFIFTSDFNEGWGVVLNEAMNSACAVVANHAIGSVPFLIKDGENGMIYSNSDKSKLTKQVEALIDDETLREKISINAYNTIIKEWNPDNAAKKLLTLYDKLINKKDVEISDGVCSKAEILDNFWIDEK